MDFLFNTKIHAKISRSVLWQCAFCWGLCWRYWKYRIDHLELLHNWWCSKQLGGVKNIRCIYCDTSLTWCSSCHAFAYILSRAVLAQKKANVGACVCKRMIINMLEFKIAQKALNKEMMAKEQLLSCLQAKQSVLKQSVLDLIKYSGKRTVTG